ncbi:hypothetical protein BABINDRAFT_163609 [Babjeviella inositovora NRRL Y-12698]|uniref:Probable endonuclease LCL3 n=1 Tax=Babjeviella inositovora NRRL Y-12698 TaxID=984486 RepID=A0A1E3QI29_9ASCO|nr:uncharacterized protein BABINDRAFT_163609 [Babjeviella inositovora NRRL Y-12698]ODQ77351.1 hypothetical protein BABINDRAFT_163609 [Babjeviella inositovora NRRL Y-12698]
MAKSESPSIFSPSVIVLSTGIAASLFLGARVVSKLRRIPQAIQIPPQYLHKKTLFGKVTSVGDGDNFRFYHTPGGFLTGWGWLRATPPINKRGYGKETLSVRLCGVDAPERAHWGNPAQPFSEEALIWLRSYLMGRRVRIKPLSIDQYQRVVAKCWVLRYTGWKDVSAEMIKNGIGVVYEGKTSAEFDGQEERYKRLEAMAKKRRRGLWGVNGALQTPGEYKKVHKQ